MLNFRNYSIRRKQTLSIMLACSVVLLLACAAFVTTDVVSFRRELVAKVVTLANVIGHNCTAALDFNDPKTAGETLASLRAEPNIVAACLYDQRGELFAVYRRDGTNARAALPLGPSAGHEFAGDELRLFQPIIVRGVVMGQIFLAHDLQQFKRRGQSYAGILALVLAVSLLVAFGLANRLQRLVSDPILKLAQVARSVALEKNYSVRATKQSSDELGQLVDGFNEMLAQIQQRDAALQLARDHLEKRVEERTGELANSLSLLNATLESTADGILVVNSDGHVSSYNRKFVELWHIPESVLATRDDQQLLAAALTRLKSPEEFMAKVKALYAHPETQSSDIVELADGRFFDRFSQPHKLGDQCIGRVWCFRDITEHKRAEQILHDSQELYSSLVENLPQSVFRKDREGRFLFCNQRFCKDAGHSLQEIVGKADADLFPPLLAAAYRQDDLCVMESGQTVDQIEEHVGKDGRKLFVQVVKTRLRDASGGTLGVQGIFWDVTAEKQLEATLAAERLLLRTLVNTLPLAVYVKDIFGCKTLTNPLDLRFTGGNSEAEVLGKSDFDFYPPEQAEVFATEDREVTEGGQPLLNREARIVLRDGSAAWLLTSKVPLRDAFGRIIGLAGCGLDITERKRAEAILVETGALLEALLQNTTDGIYFKDRQSRFVHFSRMMLELFHLTQAEELKGRIDFDFFSEEHARPAFEAEQEIIRTGQPVLNLEEEETHLDGRVTWASSSKMPWRDKAGNIIGTMGISRDITGHKRTQVELEHLHKQLMEASRRAGMAEIATNVLHNVGNVLNSVNISTGLIVESVKNSRISSLARVVALLGEHAHDLGTFLTQDDRGQHVPAHLAQLSAHLLADQAAIVTELDSLRRNVEHIKVIVAMQQNYATVGGVKEMVNLVSLVEDSLRITEGALRRHQVEVIREFQTVPPLNVEKHKILQILVNLLRNAKHACQDSERSDRRLTVRVANGEGRVKISVVDNGIGIPAEHLTRIFNHGFTTRKDGHGFGLHSGALAAHDMGGSLTAHSDGPGQGAVFTLELPLPDAGELT